MLMQEKLYFWKTFYHKNTKARNFIKNYYAGFYCFVWFHAGVFWEFFFTFQNRLLVGYPTNIQQYRVSFLQYFSFPLRSTPT